MPRMGGSSRDSFTNVDTTVGTIVWVRRRNGSWWPGRIISDADLSSANLLSPRSGTPVKLLGREDGSVDWYNIEKSKRVKPFRCGDFEECIEKAKAVAGLPTKKREKYARREDAILHALELEKQQLECSSEFISSSTFIRRRDADVDEEAVERTRTRRKKKAKPAVSVDETDSGDNSEIYPDEDSAGMSSCQEEADWNPEDDDEVDGLPRMRGLQDFGLRSGGGRGRRSLAYDENLDTHQRNSSCLTQSGKLNGSNVPSFTTRRKRTLTGAVDDGSLRKRDRRRPLMQVLETSLRAEEEDDDGLMQMVDEDEDALVAGNQALGGLEGMGVVGLTSEALSLTGGVADRNCCSLSGHATAECCATGGSEELNQSDVQERYSASKQQTLSVELAESSAQARKEHEPDQQRSRRKQLDEGLDGRTRVVKEEVSSDDTVKAARRPSSRLGQVKLEQETGEAWFDVPITRGGNVQKESVPMLSLASGLTRRAVKGYPVVVEPIDNGESDPGDEWRICRRSGRHEGGNLSRRKAKQHKESLSKKLLKKVVQSSRKTRTLSSIDCEEKANVNVVEAGLGNNNTGRPWGDHHDLVEGRPNGFGWPVATCVPVRVALSRIKAAVTGSLGS